MIENEYIEGAIYQDVHTPEKCIIIVDKKNKYWTYVYESMFKEDTCLTNKLVNEKLDI